MNYFGEIEGNFLYRIKCRLRSFKISSMRRMAEFLLVPIGCQERLSFRLKPGSKGGILLPDFFIAGAQKSGTTSLAVWLSQLPEFKIAKMGVPYKDRLRLEIQFFNNPIVRMKGLEWYSSRFASGLINGEKTPEYLFRKSALREMHRCCPEARIVIMLRNPADRAFSAYEQYIRIYPRSRNWDWVLPGRSFEDNLQAEEYASFPIGFLARGRYAEQLEYLFRVFPRDQVKIIIFERFVADPAAYLGDVVYFLGGSSVNNRVDFTPANVGGYSSRMADDTRRALRAYYRPYNEQLFGILGYRVEEWEGR
ncbi:MAG: sulfotransferase [Acidobacteriota bacterium]